MDGVLLGGPEKVRWGAATHVETIRGVVIRISLLVRLQWAAMPIVKRFVDYLPFVGHPIDILFSVFRPGRAPCLPLVLYHDRCDRVKLRGGGVVIASEHQSTSATRTWAHGPIDCFRRMFD